MTTSTTPTAWIAEIDLTRPSGATETLFLTDTAIRPMPHDDPDRPNQAYRQRLAGPPAYAVGTHADLARLAGDVGAGVLDILNGDGAYSYLSGCAMGAVRIRMGREGLWWRDWQPVVAGRADRNRQSRRGARPRPSVRRAGVPARLAAQLGAVV